MLINCKQKKPSHLRPSLENKELSLDFGADKRNNRFLLQGVFPMKPIFIILHYCVIVYIHKCV